MNGLESLLVWAQGDGQRLFEAGFLVFVRVGAVLALMPGFGEQGVPVRVRLGLALALSVLVVPVVQPGQPISADAILIEAAAGLVLGAGFRLFLMALQMAGTMAAQATSLSQLFAGAGAEPQPAFSSLLTMAALALAMAAGLHVELVRAIVLSYQMLPPGQLPDPAVVSEWGLSQVAAAFSLSFTLAAPFLIAGLIYNLALGAINRAMPTLMVALIGAPAQTLGGLVLLAVTAPAMLVLWLRGWQGWIGNPFAP
jgi:flagellar biosynthetic protein FliR